MCFEREPEEFRELEEGEKEEEQVLRDPETEKIIEECIWQSGEEGVKESKEEEGTEPPGDCSSFVPRRIHERREFWLSFNPSVWVIRVLEYGSHIPFEYQPDRYFEKNNKSAREDPEFVEGQIKEWLTLGIFTPKEDAWCVNPLSVAFRIDGEVKKKRLVIDLSRHVNKGCKKERVKLAHLLKALEITEEQDWQAVFDLEKAYFHVKIVDEHVKFLGIRHEVDGREQTFAFRFLPFGLASAVHCITKMFKPVVAKLPSLGVRYSQFIDDARVVAASKEECQEHLKVVYELLQNCGWQLAQGKCDTAVGQVKGYLGFIIDTRSMTVSVSEAKFRRLKGLLQSALMAEVLPIKEVVKVAGTLESMKPAFGPVVQICSKSVFGLIVRHVNHLDADASWPRKKIAVAGEFGRCTCGPWVHSSSRRSVVYFRGSTHFGKPWKSLPDDRSVQSTRDWGF